MQTTNVNTRTWLTATLDEAGRRLALAEEAGAVDAHVSWQDGDITIDAKRGGDGVTIETEPDDGTVPVARMVIPIGWTEA